MKGIVFTKKGKFCYAKRLVDFNFAGINSLATREWATIHVLYGTQIPDSPEWQKANKINLAWNSMKRIYLLQ